LLIDDYSDSKEYINLQALHSRHLSTTCLLRLIVRCCY